LTSRGSENQYEKDDNPGNDVRPHGIQGKTGKEDKNGTEEKPGNDKTETGDRNGSEARTGSEAKNGSDDKTRTGGGKAKKKKKKNKKKKKDKDKETNSGAASLGSPNKENQGRRNFGNENSHSDENKPHFDKSHFDESSSTASSYNNDNETSLCDDDNDNDNDNEDDDTVSCKSENNDTASSCDEHRKTKPCETMKTKMTTGETTKDLDEEGAKRERKEETQEESMSATMRETMSETKTMFETKVDVSPCHEDMIQPMGANENNKEFVADARKPGDISSPLGEPQHSSGAVYPCEPAESCRDNIDVEGGEDEGGRGRGLEGGGGGGERGGERECSESSRNDICDSLDNGASNDGRKLEAENMPKENDSKEEEDEQKEESGKMEDRGKREKEGCKIEKVGEEGEKEEEGRAGDGTGLECKSSDKQNARLMSAATDKDWGSTENIDSLPVDLTPDGETAATNFPILEELPSDEAEVAGEARSKGEEKLTLSLNNAEASSTAERESSAPSDELLKSAEETTSLDTLHVNEREVSLDAGRAVAGKVSSDKIVTSDQADTVWDLVETVSVDAGDKASRKDWAYDGDDNVNDEKKKKVLRDEEDIGSGHLPAVDGAEVLTPLSENDESGFVDMISPTTDKEHSFAENSSSIVEEEGGKAEEEKEERVKSKSAVGMSPVKEGSEEMEARGIVGEASSNEKGSGGEGLVCRETSTAGAEARKIFDFVCGDDKKRKDSSSITADPLTKSSSEVSNNSDLSSQSASPDPTGLLTGDVSLTGSTAASPSSPSSSSSSSAAAAAADYGSTRPTSKVSTARGSLDTTLPKKRTVS
jgi:hypothetical protein